MQLPNPFGFQEINQMEGRKNFKEWSPIKVNIFLQPFSKLFIIVNNYEPLFFFALVNMFEMNSPA